MLTVAIKDLAKYGKRAVDQDLAKYGRSVDQDLAKYGKRETDEDLAKYGKRAVDQGKHHFDLLASMILY